jgi:hypothetical protein
VADAALLARFAKDFGGPFLRGERSLVGSPVGKPGRAAVRLGLGIDRVLEEACERQIEQAAHFFDVTPAPFDEDAGTLLYAIHDLFACTHPQASSFYARAHLFCRAAAQAVNELPRTLEPRRLVTRHLFVERTFQTTRTDIALSWWTGSANFFGTDPPARLKKWGSVRRVKEQRLTQPMWKLAMGAGDEELRVARVALLTALLDASPLTRLLMLGEPAQKALGFSLVLPYRIGGKKVSPLDALESRQLARAITDELIRRDPVITAPPLALALLQGLREGCPPSILRRAAEVCVHLALQLVLIEAEAPGARESAMLRALLDDKLEGLHEATRVFWAVVGAAVALDGSLLQLPPAHDMPERAAALYARLTQRLAHARVKAVSEPLEREIARRLPKGRLPDAEAEAA